MTTANQIKNVVDLPGYHVFRILDRVLSIEHRKHGLSLCEDEDFVYMIKNGVQVARWSSRGATIKSIYDEADRWLPGNDAVAEMLKLGCIEIK